MADNTHIEWTEATWNPITGCSLASPGCTNCYAMQLAGTRLAYHPSRAGLTQDSNACGCHPAIVMPDTRHQPAIPAVGQSAPRRIRPGRCSKGEAAREPMRALIHRFGVARQAGMIPIIVGGAEQDDHRHGIGALRRPDAVRQGPRSKWPVEPVIGVHV